MARDFWRKAAKRGGDQVGERDDGQQGAADLYFRVARTRDEAFRKEGDKEQQRQNHSAEPPGDGRPGRSRGRILRELKKEHTGSREYGAGEQISATEDQRDAILCTLKTYEGQRGEHESQQSGYDLEISEKNGIRFERDRPEPVCGEKREAETQHVPEKDLGWAAAGHADFLTHTDKRRLGRGST